MKVFLKSDVECTVDGVGLLEPGKEVEVDVPTFMMYHKVTPGQANFPNFVTVTYATDDTGSGVGDTPSTEAHNIGSGNDEETHQGENEEEA